MMEHEKVTAKVHDILNEHGQGVTLSIAEDRVMLDDYIESAIADAVVLLAQKGYRVNVKPLDYAEGAAVPEDYIALSALRLKNWKKTVVGETVVGSMEYAFAMNEYTAPGVYSPMFYIENGKMTALPDGDLDYGEYNARYDDSVGLSAREKEAVAVCYMAAAVVMGYFGEDNAKGKLSEIAVGMLE